MRPSTKEVKYVDKIALNNFSVASAPQGSAGILPISYMYIKMMGKELIKSTQYAILNANYIMERLSGSYKILYKGANGRIAHEFIFDVREFKVKI
jgi:glycine dehydrogenase